MRDRDLAALEFPRVLARLADFAASEAGKEACRAMRPVADEAVAAGEVERAWQCFRLLDRQGALPSTAFPELRPHLRTAAHEGFVLDGKALLEIRNAIAAMREIGTFLRRHAEATPALDDLRARLHSFSALETTLSRCLDDDGGMRDEASDELAGIRRTIRTLRDTLTNRLEDLVRRRSMEDIVGDDYVTMRNNRFVIPIRAGAAGRISGVVQDRSISGETFFVEPLFAVDLNNELLLAIKEEEAVVLRLLADLTALVRSEGEDIAHSFVALVEADGLIARAKFARTYRCTQPAFSRAAITLRQARHPALLFAGRHVTPIDIVLPAHKHLLAITGPNTGGKTVALKTLGLCALMAQSGMLIPAAEGVELPCFRAIFADVGDEQNIDRNLSTFSAHVANLCEILSSDPDGALVLLDEPGVGTDPEEGAALAVGLVQHLESLGARVVLTTHYTPVKAFALGSETAAVAAVEFDVDTLTPLYRLVYRSLGRSLALPIAQRLGLPEEVLDAARAAQSAASRAWETALERLEGSRHGLEEQLAEINQRRAALAEQEAASRRLGEELRERRRTAWRDELHEARSFLRQIKAEGHALLKEMRRGAADRAALNRFAEEQQEAIAAHEADTAIAEPQRIPARTPRIGDTVEVGDRGIRGELTAIEAERAWIRRGSLRFEVPASQLRLVSGPGAPAVQVHLVRSDEDVGEQINLVGLRTREAIEQLQTFLDRAVQAGHPSVRIIHGIGSGALCRAVRDYLADSPYCSDFRRGEASEGGDGVTIATLGA
jgi:DNA mismatch repair protein MutS2